MKYLHIFIHHCVIHPLIGLTFNSKWANNLHDKHGKIMETLPTTKQHD